MSPVVLDAGPAVVAVTAAAPSTVTGTVTALAPAAVVVPGPRPVFVAAVSVDTAGLQVQVQWSADPGFTDAAMASVDAPAGLDDAQVVVQATEDVGDGLVWWRARITGGYGPGAWSAAVQFGVDSAEGAALAAGSVTVSAVAAPVAHIWLLDPQRTGSAPGEQAVVIGTGFGAAPQVWLGDLPCLVGSVADVPASGAGDDTRTLLDAWHQEITFTIADVDPDHTGDALTVVRGD